MLLRTAATADIGESATQAWRRLWLLLLLLWFCGATLRVTLFAVPPLLPVIVQDLGLNATGVGLLSTLPLLMFALAAIPSSSLIHRYGAARVLVAGMLTVLIGASLRAWAGSESDLYMTSLVMGVGIAVMQPALPVAVKLWLPQHVALGTAIYANGLVLWEIFPVWLTPLLVVPMVGGDWRWAMLVWSAPVVVALVLMALVRPSAAPRLRASGASEAAPGHAPAGSNPRACPRIGWRDPGFWLLGALFTGIACTFFIANAFLPVYLLRIGRAEIVGPSLAFLNIGQLPATLVLLVFAGRLAGRAWPLVIVITMTLAALLVMAFGPPSAFLPACALLGCSCAAGMILGLTLPALLAAPSDVRRLAAGMFTIGYGATFLVAIGGGALFDLMNRPALLFVPLFFVGIVQWLAVLGLRRLGYLR